ncbi:hypothetical protein COF42_15840 [Bacillus wiedmannii]|nr:hypothetical protein COF42_15840 [Bacillus wiedmannii]
MFTFSCVNSTQRAAFNLKKKKQKVKNCKNVITLDLVKRKIKNLMNRFDTHNSTYYYLKELSENSVVEGIKNG